MPEAKNTLCVIINKIHRRSQMILQSELKNRIIYEDNHLIAVNKKAGWLVQGDKTGDISLVESLKTYIKEKFNKPGEVFLGSIHRLDRPVSGVVIFARTSKALERMNKLFQMREVTKIYWALVVKTPEQESGVLKHYLVKDTTKNIVKSYVTKPRAKEAKEAILEYRLLHMVGKNSLLEVCPLTGRPHQIRAQLASMSCPIAGDLKYGASLPNKDKSICLHSRTLSFLHPVTKELVEITAGAPDWVRSG